MQQLGNRRTSLGNGSSRTGSLRALCGACSVHRDHRLTTGQTDPTTWLTTDTGERIGVGDLVATRLNDPGLDIATRDTWTITAIAADGSLSLRRRTGKHSGERSGERNGERTIPATYVRENVELAYATTVHGAQGETVDRAHLILGEHTSAASAYVAMTRGRHHNTAHVVGENLDEARQQWIEVFSRDRADLGPTHAADRPWDEMPPSPADPGQALLREASLHSRACPKRRGSNPIGQYL